MGSMLAGSHIDDTVTEIHLSPGTRLQLANGPTLLDGKGFEPQRKRGPLGNTSWVTRGLKILDFRCQCLAFKPGDF